MAYTDIDDPSAYFQTTLYSGTGSEQSITNTGNSDLQPDWVWLKVRSNGTYGHALFDSVRGVNKVIGSNTTNAEEDQSSDVSLSAFNSDGFTVGGYFNFANQSGQTFVSWQWKAGTSFTNDASSTSVGTIDSAGSVSTASGFSIVSWTGTGSAGTIAHGLGKLPKMIIAKQRNATENWIVYFLDTSIANNNVQNYLELNTAIASTGDSGARWGAYANYSTTTFGVGTDDQTNKSGSTYVAYVFSDIKAYSKIGKYTGNGNADGTFIYTGFKPAFLMIKRANAADHNWQIHDNKRSASGGNNLVGSRLLPNLNNAEETDAIGHDFLSNGFKLRTDNATYNEAGGIYIYMAFAENPFVTSTGVPTTAR